MTENTKAVTAVTTAGCEECAMRAEQAEQAELVTQSLNRLPRHVLALASVSAQLRLIADHIELAKKGVADLEPESFPPYVNGALRAQMLAGVLEELKATLARAESTVRP